jgi:hypothetical protein
MVPEGSLPRLQVPTICPYPAPDQSSPFPPQPTPCRSVLILSSHLRLRHLNGFPHQNPVCTSPVTLTSYMSRPSHSSRFDQPNNIWLAVQIFKVLSTYFRPLAC